MMRFEAYRVRVPSRVEADHGEGRIYFEWKDEVAGWECLTIECADGFCSRRMPMNCGLGIEGIELARDRIHLRFWPTLAANLNMDREIEILFNLADDEFSDLLYAVEECVAVEPKDVTDEEIRAEWEIELNRRLADLERGTVETIPAEEVHRKARESLERINRERQK